MDLSIYRWLWHFHCICHLSDLSDPPFTYPYLMSGVRYPTEHLHLWHGPLGLMTQKNDEMIVSRTNFTIHIVHNSQLW